MSNPEIAPNPKAIRQDIDFYKIFKVFFSRWYWIGGCIVIALIIAKINILYTPPMYQTVGALKLQESNPTINTVGMTAQPYNYTDNIQAEGFVIKSNDVLLNAIAKIDYKISYYLKGTIRTSELYPHKPFDVQIISQDSTNFSRDLYYVEPVSRTKFAISTTEKGPKSTYNYGDIINIKGNVFTIQATTPIPEVGNYSFKFNAIEDFLGRASTLNIYEAAQYTNIMNLSLTDENPTMAADLLNAIMKEYVTYDVIQKRRSANQTIEFIDKQLDLVNKKADSTGSTFARYKVKNKITDIGSSSQLNVSKLTDLEKQKTELNLELLSINQLEEQVNKNLGKITLNFNLEGNTSTSLSTLILNLNALALSREQKIKQFRANSQPIQDIDKQIAAAKNAIKINLNEAKDRNRKTLNFVNDQIAATNREISLIPGKEKDFVQNQTNFEVNNKVITFLSEKKLESELNAAAIVPGAAVVNLAYPSSNSIAAPAGRIYSFAAMMGLATGVGLILLVRFLNPYIYDKETVEALTHTPIIGVIRKFPDYIDKDSRQALSLAKPKSVFAESVRSVRTNLSFLAANKKSKTICVTSEISGEGKSFVTVNLAGTLALIDKKIILIAADLRRSKLHKVFGNDNKIGLSSYLSGQKTLEEVMVHDHVHNIDFIPSGPVPPNPSELLHTENMKHLLELLAPQYDYVLVDTAPVGLVSDAIPLIRQSDVNLFVIRSGKSQYRAAAIPERLSREYGLSNLAIVLNAFGDDALHSNYYTTDYARGGGNSTYYYSDYSGYAGSGYYDDDPKKWWEFWKKK